VRRPHVERETGIEGLCAEDIPTAVDRACRSSGGVHDEIEASFTRDHLTYETRDEVVVPQVSRVSARIFAELERDRLEAFTPPRDERDAPPAAGELRGDGVAEPGARSRDDGDLPIRGLCFAGFFVSYHEDSDDTEHVAAESQ